MKKIDQLPKLLLVGLLSLGSVVALSACGPEANENDVVQEPDTPTNVGEVPETGALPTANPTEAEATNEDIVQVAASEDDLETFTSAVEAAGLTETLAGDGPYTVFAPTNEAFEALPEGTLENLLKPENKETLAQILRYHVVEQELLSTAINAGEVETLAQEPLNVEVENNEVTVNGAEVVEPDIQADNGVIHAVNQVFLPPDLQASLASEAQAQ